MTGHRQIEQMREITQLNGNLARIRGSKMGETLEPGSGWPFSDNVSVDNYLAFIGLELDL